ncbi:glycosyltransferase family 4 protein [Patescibacteria group bacterium]|nr:glycosyltransferase family 4 protein [Patescibacteria group bacterium]
MKKKIAIVRGSNLNKWEMQNYEGLVKDFDVTAFNGKNAFFDTSQISLPIKTLSSPERTMSQVPGPTRASKYLFGNTQKLIGLEKALKDFDIVHTAGTETIYTKQCINAKKYNKKLKVVATIWENIPFAHEQFKKQVELKEFNLAGIDHFVAMSKRAAFALEVEGVSKEKISTMYIGVDLEKFKPQKKDESLLSQLNISADDFVVTTVARVIWDKGILDVLIAVSELIKKDPKVKYLLIGQGDMLSKVLGIAKRLGIEKNIISTTLPYTDIPKALSGSDVFVLPSIPTWRWQEQLGMALIEAMGSAVPVISSRSGSIDEVVGDAGILVPPADSYILTHELARLHESESLREELALRGRKRADMMFDSRIKYKELARIYSEPSSVIERF